MSAVESKDLSDPRASARQEPSDPRASARPYATLLAKGDDRKQRILAIAERLVIRNGWRNTSLAQIAKEAGVSPAGLLHHFESKEQLLNAVLDARDTDDDIHADRTGDLITEICRVAERFNRAPELLGTFTVLLIENIDPDAPLHDRLLKRQQAAVDIVADLIRAGQARGRYRADLDPAVKAIEILAFVNGMETAWLLDPSIPLNDVFKGYAETLDRDFTPQTAREQSADLNRNST
ncbi:AcrR family transcriptional regulator [Mycolicibacterium sp. 624]